jgi:hypothetical protein
VLEGEWDVDARLRTSRTTFLAAVLAVVFVACDESPSATKSSWQLDPALFPVVVERYVRVVAHADGSGVRDLPPEPELPPDGGTASPDGLRRAIVRDGKLLTEEGGGSPEAVASTQSLTEVCCVAWSPDSTRLLFNATDGRGGAYVVGADGTGIAKVSGDVVDPGVAGWSPDGTLVAFTSTDGDDCPGGAKQIERRPGGRDGRPGRGHV